MNIEDVNQFLTKVSEDPALQTEIVKAMKEQQFRSATELASKYDDEFTSQKLEFDTANLQQEERGMSEEYLKVVSGDSVYQEMDSSNRQVYTSDSANKFTVDANSSIIEKIEIWTVIISLVVLSCAYWSGSRSPEVKIEESVEGKIYPTLTIEPETV